MDACDSLLCGVHFTRLQTCKKFQTNTNTISPPNTMLPSNPTHTPVSSVPYWANMKFFWWHISVQSGQQTALLDGCRPIDRERISTIECLQAHLRDRRFRRPSPRLGIIRITNETMTPEDVHGALFALTDKWKDFVLYGSYLWVDMTKKLATYGGDPDDLLTHVMSHVPMWKWKITLISFDLVVRFMHLGVVCS